MIMITFCGTVFRSKLFKLSSGEIGGMNGKAKNLSSPADRGYRSTMSICGDSCTSCFLVRTSTFGAV